MLNTTTRSDLARTVIERIARSPDYARLIDAEREAAAAKRKAIADRRDAALQPVRARIAALEKALPKLESEAHRTRQQAETARQAWAAAYFERQDHENHAQVLRGAADRELRALADPRIGRLYARVSDLLMTQVPHAFKVASVGGRTPGQPLAVNNHAQCEAAAAGLRGVLAELDALVLDAVSAAELERRLAAALDAARTAVVPLLGADALADFSLGD